MSIALKNKNVYLLKNIKRDWQLYFLLFPAVIYFLVFYYFPIYGVQIAFRNYKVTIGISQSDWVGLEHFKVFFTSYYAKRLLMNTFLLNLYSLLWSFPVPIVLALFLNRIVLPKLKKTVQTLIYMPYFISTVVMAGMVYLFLSPTNGIINKIIVYFGGESIYFMAEPKWFRTVYIASGIWQSAGWGTILYIAALTAIDPKIYEAAEIDGANIFRIIWHIDIPSVIPIVMILLILNSGYLLSSNTEKALLLQTAGNIPTSDIIGVYVYNVGIRNAKFSYTAAIGLLLNVINFIIIIVVNNVSKKVSKISMF
jgi:putative aldouronate transport system permease protein